MSIRLRDTWRDGGIKEGMKGGMRGGKDGEREGVPWIKGGKVQKKKEDNKYKVENNEGYMGWMDRWREGGIKEGTKGGMKEGMRGG